MKRYVIDGRGVGTFDDFIEATNTGLIRSVGGEWDGNLDALNDYLYWPEGESYELEILGAQVCATRLGHVAMARWLHENLEHCHPSARAGVEQRLERAQEGRGQTLFQFVLEVVESNPCVRLILS